MDSTYSGGTYAGVAFSGGGWNSSFPWSNISDPSLFVNYAMSTDATTANTQGEIDFGVPRSIRLVYLGANNISRSGQVRVRCSNTAKFSSQQINGSLSAGVSAVVFHNTASTSQTITSGDSFTIAGDTTVYKSTTTATITAGSTASINITPNLAANVSASAVVTCRSGDYSMTTLDTGFLDVWKTIYTFGTIAYGSPSFWDGKINSEDAVGQSFPFIYVGDNSITGRYMKIEISDTTNTDGVIKVGRVFVSQGWQASINMMQGTGIGWKSNTQMESCIGGNEVFEKRPGERDFTFDFDDLPENEAYSNIYEMQRLLDVAGQLVFVYDPDDTTNLYRRTILARLSSLQPIKHPQFQRATNAFEIHEVIA